MYKAVIFDFDDTLVDFSLCIEQALDKVLECHEVVCPERFKEVFNSKSIIYWTRQSEAFTKDQILYHSFQDTLNELSISGNAGKLADIYWKAFCHNIVYEEGALEVLSKLSRQYWLGLISNGLAESQRARLKADMIENYFDCIIISEEAGVEKPDPEIFHIALRRLGVKKEEALFVGDSLEHDGLGAANAEIDFCWYNRTGKMMQIPMAAAFTVNSLEKIIGELSRSGKQNKPSG
jgi:putative hydrolase of the HAD superfamily